MIPSPPLTKGWTKGGLIRDKFLNALFYPPLNERGD